jgi:Kef-type K+ transport system membrane component KefB
MTRFRSLFFYIAVIVIFSLLVFFVIEKGMLLQHAGFIKTASATMPAWSQFLSTYKSSFSQPLAILLLQVIVIILVARLFGYFFKMMKQPSVIGEIIAGIMLGPSFFGHFFPVVSGFLFPIKALGNLQLFSQVGLILFMFVVGMELNPNLLKNKMKEAIIVSHASIVVPFALGILLAFFTYNEFAPPSIGFLPFALFIGIAMSITAFPVLARIVQERGLTNTKLGVMAITCAATDDITAWFILALVIAIVKAGSPMSAIYTILLAVVYVALMLKLVQPLLKKLSKKYEGEKHLSKTLVAVFFMTLLLSSFVSETIGIHALFGAFLAGAIMPFNANFRVLLAEKVEDVALVLLLPLFFVFTGLRTQLGLLDNGHLWLVCLLIIAVAIAGKFGGSALAAKFVGQSTKDSLSIGALMNTRGLMELVVLNIGYDLGILPPQIFTMMVIMALATTILTGPALDLINRRFKSEEGGV